MTKSITKCNVWVLEKQRKFDDAPAPIPEWKKWQPKIDIHKRFAAHELWFTMDRRLQHYLWCYKMLSNRDMTRAIRKTAEYKPNMKWNYSSGTTNLLSVFCKTVQNTSRIFRFLVHRFDRNRYEFYGGWDWYEIMWAHPTVGQLLGIGLSLACCIA
jgi:hypothetical protein